MTTRVLIADDHTLFREGLRLILSSQPDIQVVAEAASGREAVARCRETGADVVLMDISMPELNGIEAARMLTAAAATPRVIMLSMHATSEHILQSFRAGAAGYLIKEAAGAEVVEAVRAVAAGRRYVSQRVAGAVIDKLADLAAGEPVRSAIDSLSARERQVLQLVAEGRSSAEIATVLFLSPKTVETYRSRLMRKLAVSDTAHLVKLAIQHGITSLD